MKTTIYKYLLMVMILLSAPRLLAEDIDLFLGNPPVDSASSPPNVLIVLDNTANWGPEDKFQEQKGALQAVFDSLPPGEVNVGLMMFTETGTGDTGPDGGYLRAGIRLMSGPGPDDAVGNKQRYFDMIGEFDVGVDRGNAAKVGVTMAEAYLYYKGLAPYAGNQKNKADWGGPGASERFTNRYLNSNGTCCTDSHPVWEQENNPLVSKTGSPYQSPVDPDGCSKNYIIFIGNGPPNDNSADNTKAEEILAAQGGNTNIINVTPRYTSASKDVKIDEWARFMKTDPLDITTFTIDINVVSRLDQLDNEANANWSAQLRSAATVSEGVYYDLRGEEFDPQALEFALNQSFGRILAKNTVFASVALPASANTQSTFLNQVFIGMFRPDEAAKPRWPGNLKQYKLGLIGSELKLLDADTTSAIDQGTGFVAECARSFWTPSTVDNYWAAPLAARGTCLAVANSAVSNYPDGPIVEKGGQAYTRRASTTRTLFTCDPVFNSCTTFTPFATSNTSITESLLGATDATERNTLIDWARGLDLGDEDIDGVTSAEVRASVHGDVIHSRPVAINYGSSASPQVVVYYSGNDGVLRAINGNRSASIGSVGAGSELWGFVHPEFFDDFKRLRDNTQTVKFPATGTNAGATGSRKSYGIDGSMVAFEGTVNGAAKKFLYATMRRGGRAVVAFDITTPTSPALKWKKGCPNLTNDNDCTATDTDWRDLGQTWSAPSIVYAPGYNDGAATPTRKPMLLMGGGYDDCEDFDGGTGGANHNCTSSAKGRAILVLDADTGAILKKFTTDRSVVGSVTVVPVDDSDNANIMYAYATDTGGNVYRISGVSSGDPVAIGASAPSSWIMTKIASLGCDDVTTTCSANRKFLFGPDVVRVPNTDKFGILVGSGDREKPLLAYGAAAGVQNYFFSIIDQPDNPDWLDDDADSTCGADIICPDALTQVATGDDYDPALVIGEKGWRLPLAAEEQVVTGSLTIADVVNFSTHKPAEPAVNSCDGSLGKATTYNLNFENAKGEAINIIGGGLVPTAVAGMVELDPEDICDANGLCGSDNEENCDESGNCEGIVVPFCIGCGGEESAIGGSIEGTGITWSQPISRVYWNIKQ